MERLHQLSSGVRGQTMGEDIDHPTFASPTTAGQMAPSLDMLQALFDAPWETLIHLGPATKQEQDPNLSEFT